MRKDAELSVEERLARAETVKLYDLGRACQSLSVSYAFLVVAYLVSWIIPAKMYHALGGGALVFFTNLTIVVGVGLVFLYSSRMISGFGCGAMMVAGFFFYVLPFSSLIFVAGVMITALGRFAKEGYRVGIFGPDAPTLERLRLRAKAAKKGKLSSYPDRSQNTEPD